MPLCLHATSILAADSAKTSSLAAYGELSMLQVFSSSLRVDLYWQQATDVNSCKVDSLAF